MSKTHPVEHATTRGQRVLVILQGPPYGDERAFNGLRLAGALAKRATRTVRVFCFGDSVGCCDRGVRRCRTATTTSIGC